MAAKLSRRDLLKGAAGASCLALTGLPAQATTTAATAAADSNPGRILPLNCNSEVTIPPRGASFMKFSYDFPEPSVEFAGMRISFRIHTFENTYGLDRDSMKVESTTDGIEVSCTQLVWAGGQMKTPGTLRARFRQTSGGAEWSAVAEMEQPIKSVVTIVRGVPRGKISAGAVEFFDPHDDEVLLGYPFGAGALFLERGMARMLNTPLAIIQSGMWNSFTFPLFATAFAPIGFISSREKRDIASRWSTSGRAGSRVRTGEPGVACGPRKQHGGCMCPHFAHVEKTFLVPNWETRTDVAPWCRDVALGCHASRHALDRIHLQRLPQDAEDSAVGGHADSRAKRVRVPARLGWPFLLELSALQARSAHGRGRSFPPADSGRPEDGLSLHADVRDQLREHAPSGVFTICRRYHVARSMATTSI